MAEERKTNPVQFFRQVQQEGKKVTWTSWKETWVTTAMVLVMVALAALFFYLVDLVLGGGIGMLLRWFG